MNKQANKSFAELLERVARYEMALEVVRMSSSITFAEAVAEAALK